MTEQPKKPLRQLSPGRAFDALISLDSERRTMIAEAHADIEDRIEKKRTAILARVPKSDGPLLAKMLSTVALDTVSRVGYVSLPAELYRNEVLGDEVDEDPAQGYTITMHAVAETPETPTEPTDSGEPQLSPRLLEPIPPKPPGSEILCDRSERKAARS